MSIPDQVPRQRFTLVRLSQFFQCLRRETYRSSNNGALPHIPTTTWTRLVESLDDTTVDATRLTEEVKKPTSATAKTVLYLAYGSNLCRETFRGKRGIKPVSQINVVVPQLVMTFNLPGLPYTEPCFSNTRYRQLLASANHDATIEKEGYRKDAWHKGLVGVVYEVTLADYAHIIATEGGGASYQDVLVDCYTLPINPDSVVPLTPSGTPFRAHTLFAPAPMASDRVRLARPDPSYAQPSARYLKLLTDGARELSLPYEYQNYLHSIRAYERTSTQQRLGQFIFLLVWGPLLAFLFGAGRLFADEKGRYPSWLATLGVTIFNGMWTSYDNFFKGTFGDGERTVETRPSPNLTDDEQSLLLDPSYPNPTTWKIECQQHNP